MNNFVAIDFETANADIVENIQTISAITEEVSAHAGETCEACEGNIALVSDVEKIVNSFIILIDFRILF